MTDAPARTHSSLVADATAPGDHLHHFWNVCVGAGRANEGLRADWQAQLADVIEVMGFRYVRFHGLFHDDMFVYREDAEGRVDPYFQYVDVLFDRLLELGIRPFVEFAFMPSQIAAETKTVFWWGGNGSPPTDMVKWEQLIRATVQHWVQRYGIDEVATWYYEVWNEPNLAPFFRGTRSQYFEMYRRAAIAVKGVDERLRIGGPATSNFVPDARFAGEIEDTTQHAFVLEADDLAALDWQPVWLREFLDYCDRNDLPVDFVSVHPYPTDWALDEHGQGARLTRAVSATPADLTTLRQLVDASAYPHAELHLTEWSSSSSPRDFTHDHLQAATFIVKTNLESIGLVDSLSYWTFTDIFEESGAGQEPFHGGFGMLTQHGIPKPSYHAYRILSALGDTLLATGEHGAMTRDSRSGAMRAVLHHYPEQEPLSVPASFDDRVVAERTLALGDDLLVPIRITGLAPHATFTLDVIDADSGNAMQEWTRRGRPVNLSRADVDGIDLFARSARVSTLTADAKGVLDVEVPLAPWAIALLSETRVEY